MTAKFQREERVMYYLKRNRLLIFFLLICMVVTFAGCGSQEAGEPEEGQQETVLSDDQDAAYELAKGMLDSMPISRQGLIDYLSAEGGGGYTAEAAEASVKMLEDKGEADWFKDAEEAAKDYKDNMLVTRDQIMEQLTSENGDRFTQEEAEAALEKVYEE